jgi:predicted metal-dependent hydrolase
VKLLRGWRPRDTVREKHVTLTLDGRAIPLTIRKNPRAKRIIVRLTGDGDGDGNAVSVTIPGRAAFDEGIEAARRNAEWIIQRLDAIPPRVPFADGATIPFLGRDHTIRHRPGGSAAVRVEGAEIVVAGPDSLLARRVDRWLKHQARGEIAARVAGKTERLGRPANRVTLRDTRSRWGSCSVQGNLSFCWRLVMAPEAVLDYVVAHEVAHLAEPNHGPEFWRTVETLTDQVEPSRRWLRRHGRTLHRYG